MKIILIAAVLAAVSLFPTDAVDTPIKLGFLSRMTEQDSDEGLGDMNDGWKGILAAGLMAVKDFNNRDTSIIAEMATKTKDCDKQLIPIVADSGSLGSRSVKAFLEMYNNPATKPDMIAGPGRSAASIPSSLVAGVYNIPQITYWSTSKKLDDTGASPTFARTIPTDDALAYQVATFYNSIKYKYVAMLYINDGYGEAWKESFVKWNKFYGITADTYPISGGDPNEMKVRVDAIKKSGVNSILAVVFGRDAGYLINYAAESGMMGPDTGKVWTWSDGTSPSMFSTDCDDEGTVIGVRTCPEGKPSCIDADKKEQTKCAYKVGSTTCRCTDGLTEDAKKKVVGSIRFLSGGGTATNPVYGKLQAAWDGLTGSTAAGTCTGADASCAAVTSLNDDTACLAATGCTYTGSAVWNDFNQYIYRSASQAGKQFAFGDDLFNKDTGLKSDEGSFRDIAAFNYDAVIALGFLACATTPKGPLGATFGADAFKKLAAPVVEGKPRFSFQGTTGLVGFSPIGNRDQKTANFIMQNIVKYDETKKGVIIDQIGRVDVTSEKWVGTNKDGSADLKGADGKTVFPKVQWPDGTDNVPPSIAVPDHKQGWPSAALKGICLALCGINIALALIFALWTMAMSDVPVVKASQPGFLVMIAFGCIMSSSTIIPLNLDDNDNGSIMGEVIGQFPMSESEIIGNITSGIFPLVKFEPSKVAGLNVACMSVVWFYSMGFIVTFGALFAKVYRVTKIFGNKKMVKIKITMLDMLAPIAALILVDAAILIAWSVSNPLVWTRKILTEDIYRQPLTSAGLCDMKDQSVSSGWAFLIPLLVLHLVVLFYGNFLAYKGRNVSSRYSESKYIAICMVSNLQILLISIPILIIVGDNPTATVFVRSGVIFLNDLGVLLFIFLPKVLTHHLGWTAEAGSSSTAGTAGTSAGSNTGNGSAVVQSKEPAENQA